MKKQPNSALLVMVALIAILAGAWGIMIKQDASKQSAFYQTSAKTAAQRSQDQLIKSQVETAVSMLQQIYAQSKAGQMSLASAKLLGANLLRQMHYGTDGYFFADTKEGVNVVLYGRKDVEGKNRLNDVINGVAYVKEIGQKALAGGGYTDYFYSKKDGTTPLPKRAYSLYFQPFNWVVGTGYYVQGTN
jgi:methyl-accepting chemotaxis protein